MNNPLQDCILVMRRAIQQYIQMNQSRDNEKVSCFKARSFVRGGRDADLALSKLKLAQKIDYTLETVSMNYEAAVTCLGTQLNQGHIQPSQSASLAYDALITGFARVRDCLKAGKAAEDKLNGLSARGGMLAHALTLCEGHFDAYWLQAKNSIWTTKELHGIKFEFDEGLRGTVLAHFDKVMKMNSGLFMAILEVPEQTTGLTPPPYQSPAAYANPPQVVEINLGSNKVTIKQH